MANPDKLQPTQDAQVDKAETARLTTELAKYLPPLLVRLVSGKCTHEDIQKIVNFQEEFYRLKDAYEIADSPERLVVTEQIDKFIISYQRLSNKIHEFSGDTYQVTEGRFELGPEKNAFRLLANFHPTSYGLDSQIVNLESEIQTKDELRTPFHSAIVDIFRIHIGGILDTQRRIAGHQRMIVAEKQTLRAAFATGFRAIQELE